MGSALGAILTRFKEPSARTERMRVSGLSRSNAPIDVTLLPTSVI